MRLSVLPVLTALLVPAPVLAAEQGWPEYSFPEAGFAAQYPSRPQVQEGTYKTALVTQGSVKERVYSVNSGGVVYMVAIADFTGGPRQDETKVIDEAAKALMQMGQLTHDVSARIDWHYGREIRVDDGRGTSYTDAIFYIERKLYQLKVVYPEMNTDPVGSSGIHFFQQAFRLLP